MIAGNCKKVEKDSAKSPLRVLAIRDYQTVFIPGQARMPMVAMGMNGILWIPLPRREGLGEGGSITMLSPPPRSSPVRGEEKNGCSAAYRGGFYWGGLCVCI